MDIDLDFPDKWVITRLNDIAFYKKGPFGSSLKKDIFIPKSENSVKVYEQQNAIKKDYQLGNYYISLEKYEQMKSFSVFPNDIIVSCAGTVGESYIVPTNAPIGIINQALMIARLYDKDMMPYFLIYFDSVLKKQAKEDSKGTAIKNIPPFDVLKNYIIAIPPINEQKRIVAKINELFAIVEIIEQNKKELDELKELAKSKVLDLAIQGKLVEQDPNDEPASILLERIRAEKEQMVRDGKLKKRDIANDSIIYKG
ncbi:MAG: restriction endonuclease subunit S, partial [Erysipelotrichia bacterium]|nr:restriction endonuclease subunit S [Erysipelotrichia bacterium]